MTLRQMRCFVALRKYRHFTNAAASMHMTQPAFSTAIKTLERGLDTKIIEREFNNTKFYLTEAGESFAEKAAEVLRLVDNIERIYK